MSFSDATAFIEADVRTGWLPGFSMGITDDLQLGLHAPLRYDPRGGVWTALDPAPHVGIGLFRGQSAELAARAAVVIPASSDVGPHLQLGLPALVRASDSILLKGALRGELALDGAFQAAVRVPLSVTAQLTPWLFSGLSVAPDLAFGEERRTGADAEVTVGMTMASYELAHLELTARFFVENAFAPKGDSFSDGAGTILSFALFPAVY